MKRLRQGWIYPPMRPTNDRKLQREQDAYIAVVEFGNLIARKIDQLSAKSVDVITIYIPKEYEQLTSYSQGIHSFDFHDYVKAYAAQHQIATQFVREKTIDSKLPCQIMWVLSLVLYVKSGEFLGRSPEFSQTQRLQESDTALSLGLRAPSAKTFFICLEITLWSR